MSAVLGWLGSVALGALTAPTFAWLVTLRRRQRLRPLLNGWMLGSACGGLSAEIGGDWPFAIGSWASVAVALAIWWWRRKKRRSVAALLGAKSRALRDALVRRAREVAKPRPVPRPVPVPS